MKEKQISKDLASAENIIRHAYNQGYEQGLKDSKQETCEQIKWERDTAIKQLNELGYGLGEKIKPCEDAVSRQAVDEIKELMTDMNGNTVYAVRVSDIRQLPPVTPASKMGRWEYVNDNILVPTGYWRCSLCHEGKLLVEENYCPNCGSKMESEE